MSQTNPSSLLTNDQRKKYSMSFNLNIKIMYFLMKFQRELKKRLKFGYGWLWDADSMS